MTGTAQVKLRTFEGEQFVLVTVFGRDFGVPCTERPGEDWHASATRCLREAAIYEREKATSALVRAEACERGVAALRQSMERAA
jgi:hypothetical protein